MTTPPDAPAPDPTNGRAALYTALVDNVHGTSGHVRVHDGPSAPAVDDTPEVTLPTGGPSAPETGFTPEQFLAMAWSTCLGETLRVVLTEHGVTHESRVSVEVGLHRDPAGGYLFAPHALVAIDDLPADEARPLVDAAHARCPVSKLLGGQGAPIVSLVGTAEQL
jgi:lipoyl-dependent peroxiredoxin